MYNRSYEEYMRSVLGYQQPEFRDTTYNTTLVYGNTVNGYDYNMDEELEEMYPDIYRIVYPMIQKACLKSNGVWNKEAVESVIEEVYMAVEGNQDNMVIEETTRGDNKINTTNVKTKMNDSQSNKEDRQRNFMLNDLIRILVLRELIGRPGNRPPYRPARPTFPGNRPPMRPPFPGGYRSDYYEINDY